MRTIVMDSQILSMFQECGMKFDLGMLQRLKPTFAPLALGKGDILHTGFEGYYRHLMIGLQEEKDRNKLHEEGVEIAITDTRAKAALIDIDLGEAEEVVYQLGEYFDFYKHDDIIPIAVEEPFIQEIYHSEEDDLRILYAGKIDLVATAARYQWEPVPFDNKSSSRNQTPSGRSNQFFGYCNAVPSNILVVNKVGFQKTLSPAERFKRYLIPYPEEYKRNWVRNTIKWGYKLAWALDNNEWEENLTSCDKYGGCIFLPVCESINPEAREWKISSGYIVGEKWDVTKVLGLKKDEPTKIFAPTIEFVESSSSSSTSSND